MEGAFLTGKELKCATVTTDTKVTKIIKPAQPKLPPVSFNVKMVAVFSTGREIKFVNATMALK